MLKNQTVVYELQCMILWEISVFFRPQSRVDRTSTPTLGVKPNVHLLKTHLHTKILFIGHQHLNCAAAEK